MNPIVSVIIPVYNVEKYLNRCIVSVLGQTLQNIEIILIDDGSPDDCPQICDDFSVQDKRIIVVHKSNRGLASARNAGLRIASGKYIFFLDSDDWIDNCTLSELVSVADEYNVDFVRFRPMYAGWPNIEDGTICDFGTESGMHEGLYDKKTIINELYPRLIATSDLKMGPIVAVWRSLYNRDFLLSNNLFFDENVMYSEDSIFSAKLVFATNSFYYLDGPRYYHYFYNSTSITRSFKPDRWDSCKKLMKCFDAAFSNVTQYDFSNQLWLQKLFCVANALGQRKLLQKKKDKVAYCKMICCDPITVLACKHLNVLHVNIHLLLFFYLVKWKRYRLLSRV